MWKLPSWSVTSSSPKRKALLKCPEPYISKKFLSCTRLCEWCCGSRYHSLTAYCVADLVLSTFHPARHFVGALNRDSATQDLNGVRLSRELLSHKVTARARGRLLMCHCSVVSNFATPWTVACQTPLSMGFSRQEYRSGLPFPVPRDLPHPGIEPMSLMSPALAGGF